MACSSGELHAICFLWPLKVYTVYLLRHFLAINKRYERKFGYLNYFTYLRAAFLKKPRSLLC